MTRAAVGRVGFPREQVVRDVFLRARKLSSQRGGQRLAGLLLVGGRQRLALGLVFAVLEGLVDGVLVGSHAQTEEAAVHRLVQTHGVGLGGVAFEQRLR